MRITSFDELQREITKLTSELASVKDSIEITSVNPQQMLVSIDGLQKLSNNIGQLWMANLGSLYVVNPSEAERYGKRIRGLDLQIRKLFNTQCNKLDALADIAATKKGVLQPQWIGELSAYVQCSSIRGRWTYGLDPISLASSTGPKISLFYRIDLYSAKRLIPVIDPPKPSYTYNASNTSATPAQVTRALKRAVESYPDVIETPSNISIWYYPKDKPLLKKQYGKTIPKYVSDSFRTSITPVEARHPDNNIRYSYGVAEFFRDSGFARG